MKERAALTMGQMCVGDALFPFRKKVLQDLMDSVQVISDRSKHFCDLWLEAATFMQTHFYLPYNLFMTYLLCVIGLFILCVWLDIWVYDLLILSVWLVPDQFFFLTDLFMTYFFFVTDLFMIYLFSV